MMRYMIAVLALTAATFAADAPCNTKQQEKTTGALIMTEMRWIRAADTKDVKLLGCLLAPEFVEASVNGLLRDRNKVLSELPGHPELNQRFKEVKAVITGDTGVVRGINHVIMP